MIASGRMVEIVNYLYNVTRFTLGTGRSGNDIKYKLKHRIYSLITNSFIEIFYVSGAVWKYIDKNIISEKCDWGRERNKKEWNFEKCCKMNVF